MKLSSRGFIVPAVALAVVGGFVAVGHIKKDKPQHKVAVALSCEKSAERPCYQRQDAKRTSLLKKSGRQVFDACARKNRTTGAIVPTAISDKESVSVCNEGKGDTKVLKFSGFTTASAAALSQTGGWTLATQVAPWDPREGLVSVAFNGNLWVMGGINVDGSGMFRDVWSSSDGVNWNQATGQAEWPGRELFTAVAFNNRLWIMGGQGEDGIFSATLLNDVWSSADGIHWKQELANAPWSPRANLSAVVYNSKIWVMGGWSEQSTSLLNDVWSSADGVNWTEVTSAAPWPGRMDAAVMAHNNRLWVMGGQGDIDFYRDVWSSADGVNWTQSPDAAWAERSAMASVEYNGYMWVMGGFSSSLGVFANDVWYSADGNTWTQASYADWPARQYSGSATFNNKIWVMGGQDESSPSGGEDDNDVWWYQ